MKKFELLFIPSPGMSHLFSTVEISKLLLDMDDRLSITILIMKLPADRVVDDYTQKLTANPTTKSRLKFIDLPTPDDTSDVAKNFLFGLIKNQIPHVREIVSNLTKQQSEDGPQLAGLVLDMFCTTYIDVANEFSLPSYIFFTSGTCSLGLIQHLVSLKFEHDQDITQFKDSNIELSVPSFSTPVPAKVLPQAIVTEPLSNIFLEHFRKVSEIKGMMVNTFYEFESYAIDSLSDDGRTPKLYPVGPILNLNSSVDDQSNSASTEDMIKKWLDDQPENSVVFLCFGSMGSFEEAQVREIAAALENSGCRFLWSLRKPPGQKGFMQLPIEFEDFREVLPEGFLERTEKIGKVIGWAPQVAVLSHPAVGGFVSHCGWNSTLESVWFGVPIATFPLYAEQQLNAFLLVKELGMAEAIRIDYKKQIIGDRMQEIVGSDEIEAAIRRLVGDDQGGSRVRQKVKDIQNKGRAALLEGGSSYNAQMKFIEDVIKNIA